MAALMLELPPQLYARLRDEAERIEKPMATVVEEWLADRLLVPPPGNDRERARAALLAAGLLVAEPLSPELRQRVASAALTLEEVGAGLERAGGRPLSEIVLEQRGPKD